MPEINRYFRQQTIPGEAGGVPVNPEMAGMPAAAMVKFGQTLANTGEAGMRYAVAEQRAERALKAVKLEQDMKNDVDATAESYAMRTDYANFDKDVQTNIASLRTKYVDSVEDKTLKRAAEAAFSKQAYDLQKVIRDKKRVLMTEEATNRYSVDFDQALINYAAANDNEKEFIKKQIELKGYELENSHLLKLGTTGKLMQAFGEKSDEAYARKMMNTNPEQALNDLSDNTKLTNLDPIKREELLVSAGVRAREERARIKEQQKEVYEQNYGKLINFALQKETQGRVMTFKDLDNWLSQNGHDAASGKLVISPEMVDHMRNQIQARMNHLEVLGRRQPEMNEQKWIKYGELMDGIFDGTTSREVIAKQYGYLPDEKIASLMTGVTSSGKVEVRANQKPVWDYINSLKKMFGPQSFGELKDEVTHMMQDKNISPKDYFKNAQDIAAKKYSTGGNINQLIQERLNPFGGKPAQTKPAEGGNQMKANVRGNTLIYNGMEYEIINGEVTIAGQKYKVNQ